MTRSPGIEALKAEAPPDRCIACEGPLPPRKNGRRRILCRDPECARLYRETYDIDKRAQRAALTSASGADYLLAQARMIRSIGESLIRFAKQL